MSKGLEALKENRKLVLFNSIDDRVKYSDNADIIEKELKALEIVKEKIMPLVQLYDNRVYDNEDYEYRELTPEDYKLLKEVLL